MRITHRKVEALPSLPPSLTHQNKEATTQVPHGDIPMLCCRGNQAGLHTGRQAHNAVLLPGTPHSGVTALRDCGRERSHHDFTAVRRPVRCFIPANGTFSVHSPRMNGHCMVWRSCSDLAGGGRGGEGRGGHKTVKVGERGGLLGPTMARRKAPSYRGRPDRQSMIPCQPWW